MFGNQPQQQPFGSTQGFGATQGAGGGGLFGSTSAPFGGGGLGGGTSAGFGTFGQQQNPQTPLFGGSTNQPSAFGGTSQPGGLFGQSTSTGGGFGASAGIGGFGASGGNAPVNQGGGGFSSFSQAASQPAFGGGGGFGATTSSGFGQPTRFGGTQSNQSFPGQPLGGGGLFGQQQQQQQFGQTQPTTTGFGQPQPSATTAAGGAADRGFYKMIQPSPVNLSWNYQFNGKQEPMQESKGSNQGLFHNIRVEPQFSLVSIQMLRIMDVVAMKTNSQPQSYEYLASQEFNQIGQTQYSKFNEVNKGAAQGAGFGTFGQPAAGGGCLFGNQPSASTGFGQAAKPGFGGTGAFGQTTTSTGFGGGFGATPGIGGGTGTGLFGQSSTGIGAQAKPFGSAGFGGTTTTQGLGGTGGGLFGSSQPAQGGGLFGQQPAGGTGGGLFGQPQAQPSAFGGATTGIGGTAQGGGLFGQQQQPQQTSLFGGAQPTQSTSLFGGQQQQQQPAQGQTSLFGGAASQGGLFGQQQPQAQAQPGGGLFGQQPQQQQPAGSLFGGQSTAAQPGSGGLFGGLGQQQAKPAGTGLFGAQPAAGQPGAQPTGGLFGGGAQQQPGQTSLFGGAKPAQTSLFGGAQPGQQQTQPTSLFGGTSQPAAGGLFGQQQQTQQTGLFGAQTSQQTSLFGQQQKPAQSSLFGQTATQPQTSLFGAQPQQAQSLFGQPLAGQSTTQPLGQSTLFGGQPAQQQQQQQVINPYLSMDLRADPYGLRDSYLSKESPFANIDQELKIILDKNKQATEDLNPYKNLSLTQPSTVTPSKPLTTYETYQAPYTSDIEEESRRREEALKKKYQEIYQEEESVRSKPKKSFKPFEGTTNGLQSHIKGSNVPPPSLTKEYVSQSLYGAKPVRETLYSQISSQRRPKSVIQEEQHSSLQNELQQEKQVSVESESVNRNILNIGINVPEFQGKRKSVIYIKVHNSRDVKELINAVEQELKKQYQFNKDTHNFYLLYKGHMVDKNLSLKDAGITQNCALHVIFESQKYQHEEQPAQAEEQQKQPVEDLDKSAPEERLPKPPKAGYKTTPDIQRLSRMTLGQLKKVGNFTIENEHGRIQFEGETDLTDVDLERHVTIMPKSVEVYHDDDPTLVKPEVGEKLNKPAIITLFNMDNKKKTVDEKIELFKKHFTIPGDVSQPCPQQLQSQFLSYDPEQKKLDFKVFHFTKYQFDEDEDEEEDEQMQQVQQHPVEVQSVGFKSEDSNQIAQDNYEQINTFTQQPTQQPSTKLFNKQFTQKTTAPMSTTYDAIYTTQPARQASMQQQPLPTQNVTFQYQQPFKMPQQQQQTQMSKGIGLDISYQPRQTYIDEQMEIDLISQSSRKRFADERSVTDSMMQEERMIDLTQRRQVQPTAPMDLQKKQIIDARVAKALSIQERIKAKEKAFALTRRVYTGTDERLTAKEAMDYLVKIGIKQPNKKIIQPSKLIAFKPQFRNDGTLITLKRETLTKDNQEEKGETYVNHKINVTKIPIQKGIALSDAKKAYESVTQILLKHGQLDQGVSMPYLGQRFDNLRLGELAQQANQLQPHSFDDPYFEQLLGSMRLHTLKFKSDPTELFYFMEDLALHLVKEIKKAEDQKEESLRHQLQQEFYVICMINALFGNPCIHLIHLHHKFKGIRNDARAKSIFGINGEKRFKDGNNLIVEKQRRNALTEVIRFICQQEFEVKPLPPTSLDNIYQTTLDHLLNLDLPSALSHLQANKKPKMAMHLAQAFSSTSTGELLKQEMQNHQQLYKKFNGKAKEAIQFACGQRDMSKVHKNEWIRALGYYLAVKVEPNVELSKVLEKFENEIYTKITSGDGPNHVFPLLYFLIKLYYIKNHKQLLEEHLFNFTRLQPFHNHSIQDYRIKFLTTLIFYSLQSHFKANALYYNGKYDTFYVSDEVLSRNAINYANQLLRQGDWQQALLTALIIPTNSNKMKKYFVFSVLHQKGMHFLDHSIMKTNAQFVSEKLKIPQILVSAVRAMVFQYNAMYEQAINEWDSSGHINMVHNLLMDRVAPLYFNVDAFSTDEKKIVHTLHHSNVVRTLLEKLDKQKSSEGNAQAIINWKQKGSPLLLFLKIVGQFNQYGQKPLDFNVKEKLLKEIANELGLKDKLQRDNVQRFIWEYLVEEDRKLKMHITKQNILQKLPVDPIFGSRQQYNYEPLTEICNLYPDNPSLIRSLDDFATQCLPLLYSNNLQIEKNSQL